MKDQVVAGLTLSDELLGNVRDVEATKEIWKKICDILERLTLLNKLAASSILQQTGR